MNNFLIAALVLLLIFNSIATYIVIKTYFEIKKRRLYQIVFIWLVPFFGAWFAIYINREDFFNRKRKGITGRLTDISDSEAITHASAANHRGGR